MTGTLPWHNPSKAVCSWARWRSCWRPASDKSPATRLRRVNGCADGRAPVLTNGQLAGIVTPSDFSRAVALRGLGIEFDTGGADLTRVGRA